MARLLALAAAALLCAAPAAARRTSLTPEMDELMRAGIEAIYRMDFDAADAACAKAMALQPGYPHPYLGRAAVDLIRFSYGSEQSDPTLLVSFEAKIAEAVAVSEAWLKAHPDDPDGLLVLGAAHGISGRMAIVRHRWLDAFRHGRAAMKSIRRSLKVEPEMHDAHLGLGMFDYYVDTIPRFAGWLAKIMLGGDRARGIARIEIAAEKGHFTRTAAQLILVEIFTEDEFGARDTARALRLLTEIRKRYPDSAMFHSGYAVVLYENGDHEGALAEARAYQERLASGRYSRLYAAKGRALLGTMLWARGDKEAALAEFRAGAEDSGSLRKWAVWSRARVGHVLDALGRRAEALEAYRAVLAEPDTWDYAAVVRPCLRRPCVGARYPGHFAP
jgi:tetratricopeptide (TPR) repeat protein